MRVGEKVGGYEVERLLGSGGMADVWLVRHAVLGTSFALKCLRRRSESLSRRLLLEGRAQVRLRHPALLPVHEILSVQGAPALLMPFVDGPTLESLLLHRRLSSEEACAVFAALLGGLGDAHRQGYVHRGLKPSNILLDLRPGRLQPRIADFGLVKGVDINETVAGVVFGTPAYAAPEQLRGASAATPSSDLFSMGVIFAELLTGERPFPGASLFEMFQSHQAPPDLGPLRGPFRALLRDLLHLSPAQRPPSCDAVLEQLGPIVAGTLLAGRALWDAADALRRSVSSEPARPDQLGMYSMLVGSTFLPSPHNLPASRDPFIGRGDEQRSLRGLLRRTRLVTITGFGGMGKTRLAMEAARAMLADDWPGGIWFVPLAEARSAEDIIAAVAAALGVQLTGNNIAQLTVAIRRRGRLLLLLDNFEQVVADAEETVGRWLGDATEAVFLVTSREPLWLQGEQRFALSPFEQEDAVALFLERAEAASSRFQRAQVDLAEIAALVTLLDGLPLAIELAAARTRMLSPARLRARLQERFDLLSSRSATLPARQRTLRATLQWSWSLLRPWEQQALAQAAVFEGGFTVDAAEAVLSLPEAEAEGLWVEDVLTELVDKSLLQSDGNGRLRMLVSVQHFAREQLSAPGPVEQRHGAHFAELGAPAALRELHRRGAQDRRRVLAEELDNLTAAARRAAQRGDARTAAWAALAASVHLVERGPYTDCRALLEVVLPLESPWQAAVTTQAAHVSWLMGDHAQAQADNRTAIDQAETCGDQRALSLALNRRCELNLAAGRPDDAQADAERSLQIAEATGHEELIFAALDCWVLRAMRLSQPQLAQAASARMLALARQTGDRSAEGRSLHEAGCLKLMLGELDAAQPLLLQALVISRAVGNHIGELHTLSMLARAARERRAPDAEDRLNEALERVRHTGIRSMEHSLLLELTLIADRRGDHPKAEEMAQAAADLAEALGQPRRKVLAHTHLAHAQYNQGRFDDAIQTLHEGLVIAEQHKHMVDICATKVKLGQVLLAREPTDPQIEPLLSGALALARAANHRLFVIRAQSVLAQHWIATGALDRARQAIDALAARYTGELPDDHALLAPLRDTQALLAAHSAIPK